MSTYTFSFESDEEDGEVASIEMAFSPIESTHFEITEFYMRFLKACGFEIKSANSPDINDLAFE